MFTPRWKKDAKNIYKNGQKFLNYKRDLLKEDRIREIESRLDDLKAAKKGWSKEAREQTSEAIRQLDNTCENALPKQRKPDPIAENIEVIFVSLVVALGIRSYYLQPFRIPTGSMQPTLNGVIVTAQDKEEWPNVIKRTGEFVLRGRGYVYKKADRDLEIPANVNLNKFVVQNPGFYQKLQTFHTVSQIRFGNYNIMAHGVPAAELLSRSSELSLLKVIEEHGIRKANGKIIIPEGTVLYSGYADSGDLILADKVSYHFRKPKRGETFIFDTRGIDTSAGGASRSRMSDQLAATHYIKRCVGVPGDTLSISSPELLVDGKPATEKYIRRVAEHEGDYAAAGGYHLAQADGRNYPTAPLTSRNKTLVLRDNGKKPWKAQYAAMGDNTQNSLDSRYWGALEEYNVLAPAFFSLWPITTGHWGFIK